MHTGPAARLLLAEDNLINQRVATEMLRKLGHTIIAVGNGKEALAALRAEPYDLILMDIQMPEMDGIEATSQIRRDPSLAHLPIIALTAHAMTGDRERCLGAGMDDYVSKPFNPRQLVAAVQKWTQIGHSEAAVDQASEGQEAEPDCPVHMAILAETLGGDMDFAASLIDEFLAYAPGQLDAIEQHLAAGELKQASEVGHSIKGAAANLRAEALTAAAFAMECAGREQDTVAARAALATLALEMSRLQEWAVHRDRTPELVIA